MRVESDHGERLRTVLAGQPAPHRGPRRALLEVPDADDRPTVRRVVQVPMQPVLPPKGPPPISPMSALSPMSAPERLVPRVSRIDTGRPSDPPRVSRIDARRRAHGPNDAADVNGVANPGVADGPDTPDDPDRPDRPRGGVVAKVRSFTVRHLQAIGIMVVIALVFTSVQLLRATPSEVPLVVPEVSAEVSSAPPSAPPSAVAMLLVHVAGSVKNPGVVQVPQGARVNDAITAAGGITAQAHLGTLNLAALVSDGMQIMVASSPEQTSSTSGDDGSQAPPGEKGGALINLNTATQAQLESLPGVGPATATKIIAWRDQHGKFSKVEELQEIDGIGQKTFDRLKPLVTV